MATITLSGGFKPSTKDTPLDIRTRVNTYEKIQNIPNPYIGMEIIVLADETNEGRKTKYEVKGLKPNEIGIENSLIDMDTIKRVESYEVNLEELISLSKEDIDDFLLNPIVDGEGTPYATQLLSFPKIEPLEVGEYILRVGNEEIVYNNTIPNNKEVLFSGVDVVVRLYTNLNEDNTPSEDYSCFYFEKGMSTETSTDLYLYKSNTLYINEDAIPKKYISESKTQKLINKSFNELREIINNIEIGGGGGSDTTVAVKEFDSIDKGNMSTHIEFSEIPTTSKCYLVRGTIGSNITNGSVAFNGDLVYITKDNNKLNIYTLDGKIYAYTGGTNGTNYTSFVLDECVNKSTTNSIQTALTEIQNCLPLLTISENNEELNTLPDGDKVYILNGLNINNDVVHISKSGNNVTITTINGVISKYTKSGTSWSRYSTYETATKTYVDDAIANAQLSGGSIDLAEYQKITDDSLTTINKTIVGAINEIKTEIDNIEVSGSGDVFETDQLTINAVGGITANTDLNGKTWQEIIDAMLYPYTKPVISIIGTPNGGIYEKGNTQTIINAKVVVNKKSKKIVRVEVFNGATSLGSKTGAEVENGGTFNFAVSVPVNSINVQLTAKATDETGDSGVSSATTGAFTFIYPYYVGVCNEGATINGTLVKGLTKKIETKGNKSISYTTNNQCMIFAYPKSYGAIKSIIDPNNFDVTATFTSTTISITGLDGTAQDYYVYVNGASTQSNFIMKFNY